MSRIDPAKKNELPVSDALENASRVLAVEAEKKKWIEDNRAAFAAYDALVDRLGLFGEEYRNFE
ncbi:type II toxin-antitoxin system CcdA family antitoxin [Azospirillum sp. INR13]|uniref:type II toxin-antitoxin system CcdA family antitoxin n=1 Tax=Azospirillum sp. INR13 TaxID=2596919 RepID=UPI001892630F|nr:type II toxin-antitoxin system CcdA family antitoxin [Azospirillum sp. INR13]